MLWPQVYNIMQYNTLTVKSSAAHSIMQVRYIAIGSASQ